MIKLKATILLALLLLPAENAYAESTTSAEYQKCLDNVDFSGMKNSQWASCAEQEIQRQDVVLNSEYRKLRKLFSTEQNRSLTKAQASWLEFRENWCKFTEDSGEAPGGIVNYYDCIIELTNTHIDVLKSYQEVAGG